MEVLKERYSITELSEMLQLSDHTLRFYEKECELEVPKDERGRRYYTTEL
ncbi:MAG TPA: MerR family transcriptional regulator, partial [Clostridiales bacterium]|nr:MerR family transcriptional regulator [Clostridiales bacterium]